MNRAEEQNDQFLQGSVDRITFHSEETGFFVIRVKVKGHRDLITVIGHSAAVSVGEYIEAKGAWINDKKHGVQFRASLLKNTPPTTLEGVERYLGSGMIKGIGPHFAKKLVRAFGENVFDVIEKEPERLDQVEGIGEKRKEGILLAWAEQKTIRNIMVFLQSYGVGTARSVRIYKTYGEQAIEKIQEDPYCLALEIRGIGFKTADLLAGKLGIPKNSLKRARAGIRHVLQELCDQGHCAASTDSLLKASQKLLAIELPILEEAFQQEVAVGRLVQEVINDQDCVYPVSLYQAETRSAEHLLRLNSGLPPWGEIESKAAISWVEEKNQLQLSSSQREAIATVLNNKMAIITGGPGVGKTTLVKSFIKIVRAKHLALALCAPTGRAAKRLTETTGVPAKTIHRLLDFDPRSYGFKHHQDHPLPVDVLIIDEASMIDIILFNHLLKAVPTKAAVIFVGDIDQLPSVGPGAVLADLIKSNVITTVRLTEIFRQASDSKIIVNAHRINQGYLPLPNESKHSDFFTLYVETPEEIHEKLIQLVVARLPKFCRCNPIQDIQVLTPMNLGGLGSRALNAALQKQLNGASEPRVTRFGSTYAPKDKVIQVVNNYDKEVYNGDIGIIERISLEESVLYIRFDQRLVDYGMNELDEIQLAYAISIHKSQGSEFPVVVMPLAMQHYALLARNLLYTGMTRGKKMVVLIGQKKAVALTVYNNRETNRLTKLASRVAPDRGLIRPPP